MTLRFAPERIDMWPLSRLQPYARNAKAHGADQVARIAASMAEFGWTVPCLVAKDGELIAGHGRVLAAAELGLSEAPVIVLGHLSEAQRRAYRIAGNKLTELGSWDEALLAAELQDLLSADFDLSLTGFDEAELDQLLAEPVADATGAREGEDEVPDAPEDPVSRPGDLWCLGPHRLLCGDATVASDVERALGGMAPLLMVTDPPYGVAYDPSWRNRAGAASTRRVGKVLNDDRADWREAWALYRSPEHNRAVGGAKRSKHMEGAAFDIAMANHDPAAFEAAAREVGFLGFGFYPRPGFMHIDLGPARQWGERFPARHVPFVAETPPAREALAQSRTMKAGGAAGVATLGSAGVEVAQSVLTETRPQSCRWCRISIRSAVHRRGARRHRDHHLRAA